jgi:hypothetical protein
MLTVLGFDDTHTARAVEIAGNQEEIQLKLENMGWTNLVFLQK